LKKARLSGFGQALPKNIGSEKKMPESITGKSIGLTSVRGRLLSTREVAVFLRRKERTVQDWMQKGTFPIRWYPVGPHNHLVDSEDLNDYLKKIRAESGTVILPETVIKQIAKEEVIA
jgi:hypothetical protein